MFVISYYVYPWQAFLVLYNTRGKGQVLTLELSARKVFHSARLQPYLQTFD
jgi:hypothetical protein